MSEVIKEKMKPVYYEQYMPIPNKRLDGDLLDLALIKVQTTGSNILCIKHG